MMTPTRTFDETDYRSILAIAARDYPKHISTETRIIGATLDYCDDPNMTNADKAQVARDSIDFFRSI